MDKLKSICLEEARGMNESTLQLEIRKRADYLREELGMTRTDCADFITSLLNLGASLQEKIDSKKTGK